MRLGIIVASFKSDFKTFLRSKGTLFWTLAFPVMLILMFGAIFSGADNVEYDLYVIDYDNTDMSNLTISVLKETGVIKPIIVDVPQDEILSYIKENDIKRMIVIPEGYQQTIGMVQMGINEDATTNLSFYFDQSEQQTSSIVKSVISSVVINMNMNVSGGKEIIHIHDIETISGEFNFIDFFVPGMIGFTIMQTCIYGSLERNAKFRKDGILRKLQTTPITRSEWIFSKMLFQLFLSFVSALLIIVIGIGVYGMIVHINVFVIILVVATSFLFTGIGMLVGRFVKDEESAGMAGGAITFPMMFLAGTFFPLEQMPSFLQVIARIMPLYYVNEGLRNAMIYLKTGDTIFHTSIVLVFAFVFFVSGLVLTKWKED